MILHFEMVVSAGKVADLQRVGTLSSLGEFSIYGLRKKPVETGSQMVDLSMDKTVHALQIRVVVGLEGTTYIGIHRPRTCTSG